MLKYAKKIVIAVLAVLGAIFILLMLLPDDEEDAAGSEEYAEELQSDIDADNDENEHKEEESVVAEDTSESIASDEIQTNTDVDPVNAGENDQDVSAENVVSISIPSDQISENTIRFKSMTLDNKKISQDIFKKNDLTVVHVWGTYCGPCKEELGDYGKFSNELPDNIGLIGIVVDVYDGIDRNLDTAQELLNDADASFTNIRISDDVYDVISFVRVVPSTFFVDSEGHIIGELIEGSGIDRVKQRLNGYIK